MLIVRKIAIAATVFVIMAKRTPLARRIAIAATGFANRNMARQPLTVQLIAIAAIKLAIPGKRRLHA